jgi:hypothetical protein
MQQQFLAFWNQLYPETPPINYLFKHRLPARWARIHSLPKAKRYAQTDAEWDELKRRQNAVIDSLVPQGTAIRVVVNFIEISNALFEEFDFQNIGVFVDKENETVFQSFQFETVWQSGCLDQMLVMIADDRMRAFIIAPDSLIAPYDGGVDIILKDEHARDDFKERFKAWLSGREDGL